MSWTVRGWAVVCVLALLHIAAVRAVRLSARDAPPQANNNNNNNGPSSSSSSGEGSGSAELSESSRRASESSRSEESTVSQFLTESGQPDPKKLFGEFVPTPESSEGSRAQRTNSSANSNRKSNSNRSGSGSRNRTGEFAEHGSEASRVSESSKVELSAEEVASIQRQSERSAAEYSEELKHEFSESARIIRSWSSTAPRSASLSGESNPFSSLGSLESSAEASWSSLASNSALGLSGASDSLSDLESVSLSSQDRRKDSASSDASSSSFSSSSSSGSLSHSGPSEAKKGGAFTDDEASIQRRIDAALKPEPGDVKMAKFLTKLVDPSAPPKPAIVQYNRNYIKQIDVTKQNPTRDVMEEAHKKQLALGAEVHEEETHKMNLKDVAHARKVTAKQLARSKQSLKWQRDFTVKARAARKQAIKESELDAALLHKEAKEEAEKQRAQLQRIASENKAFHAKLKHEQQLFLQRQESSAKQQAIEKQKQLEADARRADEERKKDQEATVQGRNAAFAKTQRLESEVKAARVKAHQDNRAQEARAKRQTGALVAQQRRTDIDKIQRTSEAEAQATRDRITKDADRWAESKQKKANEMQQKQQAEASVKKQTQTEETSKRTNEQNYKHHYNNEQQSKSDWLKRITDDRRQWYRRYYGR